MRPRHLPAALLFSASALAAVPSTAEVFFRGTGHIVVEAPKSALLEASRTSIAGLDVVAPSSAGSPVTVRVVNSGELASVVPVPSLSGPFALVSDECTAPLAPDEGCEVSVRSTASSNGDMSGSLTFAGMDGSIPLSGVASGFDPIVSMTPGSGVSNIVDGSPTSSAPVVFTVSNVGFGPSGSIVVSFSSGGSYFAVGGTCGSQVAQLAARSGTCTVTLARKAVANSPSASAELSVVFALGGSATASVTGTASGFDPVVATSALASFSVVPGSAPVQTVRVSNIGKGTTTTVPAVSVSGDFAVTKSTCTSNLAVGGECTAEIRGVANANKTLAGNLTVAGKPGSVALSGSATGFAPVLTLSTLNAFTVTSSSAPTQTLTVTNTGTTVTTTIPTVSVTGDFTVASSNCTTNLVVGGTCTATIKGVSTTTKTLAGTVVVAGRSGSTSLSGTASGFSACASSGASCGDGYYYVGTYSGLYYYVGTTERAVLHSARVAECSGIGQPISESLATTMGDPLASIIRTVGINLGRGVTSWTAEAQTQGTGSNSAYYYGRRFYENNYTLTFGLNNTASLKNEVFCYQTTSTPK